MDTVVVRGDRVVTEYKLTTMTETKPVVKEVIIEEEPKISTVRRVIERDPSVTTVTRIIGSKFSEYHHLEKHNIHNRNRWLHV